MNPIKTLKRKMTSFQVIIIAFAGVILIGALFLMLPVSSNEGVVTSFSTSLFTSTSAVCVTGLVLKDTATYWSHFGQFIIIMLVQIGGLGVISVAAFLALVTGKKITLSERKTIQNAISAHQFGGMVKLISFVFKAAFIIEITGFLLLLPFFCKKYGLEGIWMALFHSVSAFCNAGFDLMGNKSGHFTSLTMFKDSVTVTVVISGLIIAGGLGFMTWEDIVKNKLHLKKYRMQSKVILLMTLILVIIPTVSYFFVDFSNLPFKERFLMALFQAVTPRTAGFNTADFSKMTNAGIYLMVVLMLIGGAPGSTAGGMKTTTIAVLYANAFAVFKRRTYAGFFGRRLDDNAIKNAATLIFLYVLLAMTGALIISFVENVSMEVSIFEAVSALATVGLTLGITPSLGIISQIVLIILMFLGRVGGLTLIYAAFDKKEPLVGKLPLEQITIG
ncbi:trk system potassium uptake protein TrkH [Acetitomaculum ruminis DSM 5522]|uniref:Trk system potassium uptake protein TrkH n=1 Tax=Acetitomaculum ruminis DSM 5522 TaxID=1120918 RepID=A0A1I0YUH6_9FIRM|nr:potassium transporter TrkG [Acetitomaculum ruminis]SFB17045.1 trk system potassium uptake protein TrkH [Acetitomaculum ruminis DSM 5522]